MGFFKTIFILLSIMFAYRILKRLFLPAASYSDASNTSRNTHQHNYSQANKSREIEDVDYEEVD